MSVKFCLQIDIVNKQMYSLTLLECHSLSATSADSNVGMAVNWDVLMFQSVSIY